MKTDSFLINPRDRDATMYLIRTGYRGTFMFDCGENGHMIPRLLRRVSHLFITHCHIDHFIGFDNLLRLKLYEDKTLEVYGPTGITRHVRGRLDGYTWNLTPDLRLTLRVHEVHGGVARVTRFDASEGFLSRDEGEYRCDSGVLLKEAGGSVLYADLDHSIPALGFAFQSNDLLRVREERLRDLGLTPGPWIRRLMDAEKRGQRAGMLEVEGRQYEMLYLQKELLTLSPGHRIAYVVDTVYNEENAGKIVELARGARKFYCEATFTDADYQRAADRYHLTARQAGMLARQAGVEALHICHFSKRYNGNFEQLYREAAGEFPIVL